MTSMLRCRLGITTQQDCHVLLLLLLLLLLGDLLGVLLLVLAATLPNKYTVSADSRENHPWSEEAGTLACARMLLFCK